jgi:pimeloyl-[acyl-carrier protein] methyl ester esterase
MPPIVFLHGWGQSARIWDRQVAHFSQLCPVSTPNLPGHGGAHDAPAGAWPEILARQLPEDPAILVGWSLGGMLALQLAHAQPERVAGLALVSTTPCFARLPDWPQGCDEATLQAFSEGAKAQGVGGNPTKLLGRFFALMLQGDALPRSRFNALAHEAIDRQHPPTPLGLSAGLELLAGLDLRSLLPGIAQPAWVAHGDRDAIIPPAAGRELADRMPHATWHGFAHAGHAPFLSQAETFQHTLEAWCRNISSPNA